ncbi:tetraspanin-9-like [Plodia interpunctella]|uniref:tetraspanin-9-like n=1 Tax=Plodia interpunctella TaxID=58824 RepID=UPI0023675892|nr:tetraspanin-9-like [Plodia interpunctella]
MKVLKLLKSVRYSLAALNGLLLLTGLLLLIVGSVVLVTYLEYELVITQKFFSLSGLVIATGVIIILAVALGLYGAISEQFYVILGYVALLLAILVFEISAAVVSLKLKSNASSEIRASMQHAQLLYETRREITILWDDMQMGFECCGVVGRNDWVSNRIPISCCHIDYGTISPFYCNLTNAYTTGCAAALGEWLSYNANVIGVTSLIAITLTVLISAAAGWLAWRSKFEEVELES